jgi:hypothetical protein
MQGKSEMVLTRSLVPLLKFLESPNILLPRINIDFMQGKTSMWFMMRSEGIHKLYLLLANESVSAETIAPIATDILKNVKSLE